MNLKDIRNTYLSDDLLRKKDRSF
ncbi:hypothetical protein SPV_2493 [Streptococcus pneumoniae]|nr:hypothetical protein SPV_2493 [Streptococcus pneumoniae]